MGSPFKLKSLVVVSVSVFETDVKPVIADATGRIVVYALEDHVVVGVALRMLKPEGPLRIGIHLVDPYVLTIAHSDSSDVVLVGHFDHETEVGAVNGLEKDKK